MSVPNPALAPRLPGCRVCSAVHALEDVAWRIWREDGSFIGYTDAAAYLRSIGMTGSDEAIRKRIARHRAHVEAWLAEGAPNAYTPGVEAVRRIATAERGPVRWLDVAQTGAELGMESLRLLSMRLGTMDDRDLIAVAKLGLGAANKIGDMEARGRALYQVDGILRLAAGLGEYDGDGHRGSSNQ